MQSVHGDPRVTSTLSNPALQRTSQEEARRSQKSLKGNHETTEASELRKSFEEHVASQKLKQSVDERAERPSQAPVVVRHTDPKQEFGSGVVNRISRQGKKLPPHKSPPPKKAVASGKRVPPPPTSHKYGTRSPRTSAAVSKGN